MPYPSVMFVHAHPDDESLWTGGVIARSVAAGAPTSVITCTWSPGTHRHAELVTALGALGAAEPVMLGWADDKFPDSAPGRPRLRDCSFDEAVAQIVAEIRRRRPQVVVTYDAFGIYGHPDHIHAHRLAVAAVEAAACGPVHPELGAAWQVSSLYFSTVPTALMKAIGLRVNGTAPATDDAAAPGTPDHLIDTRIDVTPWLDRKWEAINAHASEVERSTALKVLVKLDVDQRTALLGTEWFLRRDLANGGIDLGSE